MQLSNELMISISGIRGVAPHILNEKVAYAFTNAFCKVLPAGAIIVSRDSRKSGLLLKKAVIQALIDNNREILNADLATLPTTQLAVEKFKSAGAVDITASHNPEQFNGLKFLGGNGESISQKVLNEILDIIRKTDFNPINYQNQCADIKNINRESIKFHLEKLAPLVEKGKKIRVAVDAENAAGSEIILELLVQIGCEAIPIATDPSQPFPHTPEPTPQNLQWTQDQLKDKEFDLCVVVDPDADRLSLIDEKGNLLPEEYTLPLILYSYLLNGKKDGTVVVNMSTSRMIEDVAKTTRIKVYRSKVGEVNVVEKMKETKAFFGGEGNGGVINPKVHFGRDALVGIAHIVSLLRKTGCKLSDLCQDLMKYYMKKEKVELKNIKIKDIYLKIKKLFSEAKINEEDGLRLDFDESWVHIRVSNTEPIIRVIAEAKTQKKAQGLVDKIKDLIK